MSVRSSIKSIYQSLERKINKKEFNDLYSKIYDSYKVNNTKILKKVLSNSFINYDPNDK